MAEQLVSIVLATHNGEKYLRQQLDSIEAQTRPPTEIILTDDASTDSTPAILGAFEARTQTPVIRISNVPGLGFADNFLRAAERASGDWIAFCDQDDVWLPNKIETCSKFFGNPDISMIVHAADLIDAENRKIGHFSQGITETAIRPPLSYDIWGTFWGFSIIFRRKILEMAPDNRFLDYIDPEAEISHDRWISFLGQVLGKTAEIAEPLVQYRQHGANLYGQGKRQSHKPPTRAETRETAISYLRATQRMVEIIAGLDRPAPNTFPAFDREKSLQVFGNALRQIQGRNAVYAKSHRLAAGLQVLHNTISGVYSGAHNGEFRKKSLAKDILYCLQR
jgi:glycosyltransferase involved in cell wall biosynthesis